MHMLKVVQSISNSFGDTNVMLLFNYFHLSFSGEGNPLPDPIPLFVHLLLLLL